ncbi:DUF5343 domain-containing protein [Xanthocytophaga agilis]|uniref:DUF5343 domain-containing protein n=1 Tax=Xanthocytophaga agilis TaxID=3048010 RepID=A0AAE3R277_9BACT|nr:DUF5343 domain-containing protein [Xanthocytophaga agilis]MDJ1502326.1 DUF5343 domain-containing protein [Xanthocytophaga agilis]
MASEISYPKLSVTNWWALRKKFQSNPNIKITPGFLAMHFEMGEDSARTNVLPPLRAIGFIDDDGRPTDLAYDWRDDEKYGEVCDVIRRTVYPQELNDAVIDPADRVKVETWFKNKARVGEASARKMAAFYLMLCEAVIPGEQRNGKANLETAQKPKENKSRPVTSRIEQGSLFAEDKPQPQTIHVSDSKDVITVPTPAISSSPNIQITIQIQLSSEYTPDQLDQVFASLIKNIKKLQE